MQRRMLDAVASHSRRELVGICEAHSTESWLAADAHCFFRQHDRLQDGRTRLREAMDIWCFPGLFSGCGNRLVAGQDFHVERRQQNAPRVAVVNQEFARKVFGSEEKAIGSFFKIWGGTRVQVVGLVEDGKYKT